MEEKLLWALCAVIDLVFLSMGREYMLLQLVSLNKHCETDGALEGTTHPFEAVLYQVTLKFGGGVKGLAAEFALMVQPFIISTSGLSLDFGPIPRSTANFKTGLAQFLKKSVLMLKSLV